MARDEIIAGIDEAGRGALAGPVVAGACFIPCALYRRRRAGQNRWSPYARKPAQDCLIADSKQLSPEERETAYEWIVSHCAWGVGSSSAEVIERLGIVRANHLAMLAALEDLRAKILPDRLFVDGNDRYVFPYPHESVIRGDALHPCIAAASIIAKVTRDRWMIAQHDAYDAYGFARHKGYGSEEHIAAIKRFGPCPLHRPYFLQRILAPAQQPLLVLGE